MNGGDTIQGDGLETDRFVLVNSDDEIRWSIVVVDMKVDARTEFGVNNDCLG